MLQLKCEVDDGTAVELEEYFCEYTGCSPWCLFRKNKNSPYELYGYFENENEYRDAWSELRSNYPALPDEMLTNELDDRDWKEEYKKFLKPWSSRSLHWAPEWMKEQYEAPSGDKVVYFDAGMAFGTGSHETTQLCALRMLDVIDNLGEGFNSIKLIDAGCGSGILSISASLLGCKDVYGFDRDPEAIRVSKENLVLNQMPADSVQYEEAGLEDGLKDRKAELILANIQADVLCIHDESLLNAIAKGGILVLSGILAVELDSVREKFDTTAKTCLERNFQTDSRVRGEWCDLVYSTE